MGFAATTRRVAKTLQAKRISDPGFGAPRVAKTLQAKPISDPGFGVLASRVRTLVVTCGDRGAIFAIDGKLHLQCAPSVEVVDTVGAGDAFAGALAAALDRGDTFVHAVRDGVAAGALACTSAGAQAALPSGAAIAQCAKQLPRPMPYA
jgi:ribokinase